MGLLDYLGSPLSTVQGGGQGILGGVTPPNKAQLLFAGLSDAAQAFQGRQGDAAQQVFGQGERYAQAQKENDFQKDVRATIGPDGQINRDALISVFIKHGKDPVQMLGLQMQQANRVEDRQWQLGDRASLRSQQLEDDARKRGYEVQDRNSLTAYQRAQLASDAAKGSGMPAAPSGYRWNPDGTQSFVPGGPADPAVAGRGTGKPTEDQAKNAQLYTLSQKMLPQVLNNFDELGNGWNEAGNFVGGALTSSSGFQQAQTGLRSLVANFLYSTSGATATPQEVENRLATVMPRVGESADTREKKRQAIIDMVESIKVRASPQLLDKQQEQITPGSAVAAPNAAAPSVGTVQDGYRFKGGNPADPNSWERVR